MPGSATFTIWASRATTKKPSIATSIAADEGLSRARPTGWVWSGPAGRVVDILVVIKVFLVMAVVGTATCSPCRRCTRVRKDLP